MANLTEDTLPEIFLSSLTINKGEKRLFFIYSILGQNYFV